MKKISAKDMVAVLNEVDDGVLCSILTRFATECCEPTSLMYSLNKDGEKTTSSLGVINGLLDEPICMLIDESDPLKTKRFKLVSEIKAEGRFKQ